MRTPGFLEFLAVPLLAGLVLAPLPATAGDHDRGAPDAVRRAVEAGEIKSLADILASLRGKLPGQVAGIEIERARDRWIYEFRIVDEKGRLYQVHVDARSGEIERIKEK
ncbi:peptidase [Bradyrhizobium nitroreducens]|uniref:Peptidase n=1 Tax=Bradyrhizobium nitroreducens TaxID=709803 RepID=A0A2M6UH97_9BRAD|nr:MULTISPECIES: PepSY domain-containing protein [Bradyrhizobium]PIT04004.1 peptidase [Bradyrhizobium nitroreducens]TQF26626.1 peptidase [Bradyrhizobium sp. UNPF46]